jgi:RNA recognition motif-containing protein
MALNSLNADFQATNPSERKQFILNKNSAEFKPENPVLPANVSTEEDYFSTMGSALDELLAEVKMKYLEPPSVSPMLSTANTTPQISSAPLPPPPGYDPIVETNVFQEEDNVYYDPSYAWRSYPLPFHMGFKLFVGALPYSVCEADLFPLFSQFGEILELHIQRDWLGRSKGCAWLRYSTIEECDAAIDALHNNYYLGSMNRPLQLTYATDKAPSTLRPRTMSMTEDLPPQVANSHSAARSRAMTDCSIPTPSSSVLGKLRQMMSSSDQSASIEVAGASPVKEGESSSGGIFKVSGIPSAMTDKEVENLFSQFGPLARGIERVSPTVAVVEFRFPADAERTKSVIDGVTLAKGDTPISVETVV